MQKDSVLEELERLTEGLAERAHASHDPALGLSLRMDEARLSQQQLTRRGGSSAGATVVAYIADQQPRLPIDLKRTHVLPVERFVLI